MADIFEVVWGQKVDKQLTRLPRYIQEKFLLWVSSVRMAGILEVRKRPGLHDEPLKGIRKGERSIRLSRAYRAIYREGRNGALELIEVIEVNKHEY